MCISSSDTIIDTNYSASIKLKGTPDSFNKSCYDVAWLHKVGKLSIASITPRIAINRHAVFPLVFQ